MSTSDQKRDGAVTILIASLSPTYGAARVAIDIAAAISKHREVTILTCDGTEERNASVVPPGVMHRHIAREPGVFSWIYLINKLRLHIRNSDGNTRYLSFLTTMNLATIAAAGLTRRKSRVFATEHNIQSKALANYGKKSILLKTAMRLLYIQASSVICVSHSVKNDIEEICGRHGVHAQVIYNPIDLPRLRGLADDEIETRDNDLVNRGTVVCVAELKPAKRIDLILEAMTLIDPPLTLILIGDGSERARLEQLAVSLGIAKRVTFVGRRENPWPIVSKAGATVLVPKFEGFGLAAAESAAVGILPIGLDIDGLGEVIRGVNGVLVDSVEGSLAAEIARTVNSSYSSDFAFKPNDEWLNQRLPERVALEYLSVLCKRD